MSSVVLDSSAVLALLHHEAGEELVWQLAPTAFLSAVNAAEVHGKLMSAGFDRGDAWDAVVGSVRTIVPFDSEQAEITGSLVPLTRARGLSLGVRACLALGRTLKLPVYTADRSWSELRVDVDVRLIR
jgi:PIN domain nuclease of toxin-antitoxin system